MTTTVLRPDGTIFSYVATPVGAASLHAATNDNSDASYGDMATGPFGNSEIQCSLGTFAFPSGAVTKTVTVRARCLASSGNVVGQVLGVPGGGLDTAVSAVATTYTGAADAITLTTQAQIDALQVSVRLEDVGRIHEIYVDLVHATAPVTAVSAPTGVQSTSSVTATWSHTPGSDGGPQSRYRLKYFTAAQYGIGGFDPETSPHTYDSGEVVSAATSLTLTAVPNSTTWRAYVKTAQTINGAPHWAAWAFSAFSTSFTEPLIASVVVTPATTLARNTIVITRVVALPLWTQVTLERSDDAGATWVFVRGATEAAVTGNTHTVYDYEAPFVTACLYRARAIAP